MKDIGSTCGTYVEIKNNQPITEGDILTVG